MLVIRILNEATNTAATSTHCTHSEQQGEENNASMLAVSDRVDKVRVEGARRRDQDVAAVQEQAAAKYAEEQRDDDLPQRACRVLCGATRGRRQRRARQPATAKRGRRRVSRWVHAHVPA